jgi:hypothetical protein
MSARATSYRPCVYCGEPGARTVVLGGFAHKRCVLKPFAKSVQRYPKHYQDFLDRRAAAEAAGQPLPTR